MKKLKICTFGRQYIRFRKGKKRKKDESKEKEKSEDNKFSCKSFETSNVKRKAKFQEVSFRILT